VSKDSAAGGDARNVSDVIAGSALIAATILALALILHHPVVHARSTAAVLEGVKAQADVDRLVHGGLITLEVVMAVGLIRLSARLGLQRLSVMTGAFVFTLGTVVMTVPALLDGFVSPDLARLCSPAQSFCHDSVSGVVALISLMIQDFTRCALIAQAAAIFFWSLALVTDRGAARLVGLLGLLAAAAGLAANALVGWLTPRTLIESLLLPLAWFAAAGALLAGRKSWAG
jgi:hypothetical protein